MLIGLDGGASKINGWTIDFDSDKFGFRLGKDNIQKTYGDYPEFIKDFRSVDLAQQLKEFSENQIRPTATEQIQAKAYTQAVIDVVREIADRYPNRKILIGIGMPGLKTSDDRGIAVLLNGPRMPEYTPTIELALRQKSINLIAPIQRIGSDADYCGIGEEYSAAGSFTSASTAYYLGGGTGAADALKINDKLVPFDDVKPWLAKTWELQNDKGKSLERYASAGGIQSIYSDYSGISVTELNKQKIYPNVILERAIAGEAAAVQALTDISDYLAQLIFERIQTAFSGWHANFKFMNPKRENLISESEYSKLLFDRIIFGQRLGDLLNSSQASGFLWQPLLANITDLIIQSQETALFKNHYLKNGRFNEHLISFSALREAPAIGAGIDAYLQYKGLL